jgi:hypothetical protein
MRGNPRILVKALRRVLGEVRKKACIKVDAVAGGECDSCGLFRVR